MLRYYPEAEAELDAAFDYLRSNGVYANAAADFVNEVEQAERRLVEFPNASSRLGRSARRLVLRRFPYQLIYRVEADVIVIYAVAHQSRRPGYWRKRLKAVKP